MPRSDTRQETKWKAEGLSFKRLYEEAGMKQSALAEALSVSPDAVSRYATGHTRIPFGLHDAIARALGLSVQEVRERIVGEATAKRLEGKPFAHETTNVRPVAVDTVEFVSVPVYGAISAHGRQYNDSDVVESIKLPKAQGGREQWGRVVSGTCMETEDGQGFEDGDIAIFEDAPYEDGMGVHAFRMGEETFKVYREVNGRKELWPTNLRDGSEPIVIDDNVWTVRGVCMGRIRRGRGYEDVRRYPHGYRYRFRGNSLP